MDQTHYPFTDDQYFKLRDAVKDHKKILFTGAPGSGKTFAMYQLISMLRQDISEEFSIFETEMEASYFGLTSTILSRFDTSRFPELLIDSEGTVRVFGDICYVYARSILALCEEQDGLIASVSCKHPEFVKQTLQEKFGLPSMCLIETAFDLCVHINPAVETNGYRLITKIASIDILDYNQLC